MKDDLIRIGMLGACGRMGLQIVKTIKENPDVEFSGGYDVKEDDPELLNFEIEPLDTVVQNSDIVIDFSVPDALESHLNAVIEYNKAIVIGTTGFEDRQKMLLKKASEQIPCLFSPNMSVGMNVLFEIVGKLAKMIGEGYDFEIIEKHHNSKKDAPGGTALELMDRLIEATGRDREQDVCYGRRGKSSGKNSKEIGIHAVRAGGIVGEHTVLYAGDSDFIEITHKVQNRRAFALGAVRAAIFLSQKDPGLYSLLDMIR